MKDNNPADPGQPSATFAGMSDNNSRADVQRLKLETEPKSTKFKSVNVTKTAMEGPTKPTEQQAPPRKEILYKLPKCKIGDGKAGPVELVIYKDELYAMKRVPKSSIDKPKRIQHLKGEKYILMMLN